MRFCYQKIEMRRWLCKKIFLFLTAAGNYFFNFWRSRNPPNVEDVIRRLQQAAEPPSSAHFVSCAVAFTLRLKPRKMRGTYTEIARLQPDCNFSVKLRKMRRSGFHLASVITLQYNRYLIQLRILTKLMRHPFRFLQIVILLFTDRYTSQMRAIP